MINLFSGSFYLGLWKDRSMSKIIQSIICHIYFLLLIGSVETGAQIITIKQGGPVIVDGQVTGGEWSDADSIVIPLSATNDVTVKYKHDGINFNFAFLNNLESFNIRFPEIMFDIDNDKSSVWLSDDWWFHVSATDCESNTAANDYSNCQIVQPDWIAANNFNSGPPVTDTVEIQIPFSKVNFNSTNTDTIGLVFDVTNTFSVWNYWPNQSVLGSQPSTWGTAIVELGTTSIDKYDLNQTIIRVSPNPIKDKLIIHHSKEFKGKVNYIIRDIHGKQHMELSMMLSDEISHAIDISTLANGVYILECKGTETNESIKIIINK